MTEIRHRKQAPFLGVSGLGGGPASYVSTIVPKLNYMDEVFDIQTWIGGYGGPNVSRNAGAQVRQNGLNLGNNGYGGSSKFVNLRDDDGDFSRQVSSLSRTSNLTGNADSKTFTFSCWVFWNDDAVGTNAYCVKGSDYSGAAVEISIGANGTVGMQCFEPNSGTRMLDAYSGSPYFLSEGQWHHVLISIDMANSSNRYVYVDDVNKTSSLTWDTYSNQNINFAPSGTETHRIGTNMNNAAGSSMIGWMAHLYLDHTYRDLSTESNRRLFRTAAGQPVTNLASLNPIIYLPMNDATAGSGKNLGTGGDFTPRNVTGDSNTATQGPFVDTSFGPETGADGDGGMVWIKDYGASGYSHMLYDTIRGPLKHISTDTNGNQGNEAGTLKAFNRDGYTLGSSNYINKKEDKIVGYSWKKTEGFFDMVQYTGNNSSTQVIDHNLKAVPGVIMVKCLGSGSEDWAVYHSGVSDANNDAPGKQLRLNTDDAAQATSDYWNNDFPTATQFTVGNNDRVNKNGSSYIAYIFGGGPDPNAGCGYFNASGSKRLGNGIVSNDLMAGTGDFTAECFFRAEAQTEGGIFSLGKDAQFETNKGRSITLGYNWNGDDQVFVFGANRGSEIKTREPGNFSIGQWYHAAIVKESNVLKLYINGRLQQFSDASQGYSDTYDYENKYVLIGGYYNTSNMFDGMVSNFRYTKGQALYTADFKPPTKTLTTTSQGAIASNVKILCLTDASNVNSAVVSPNIVAGTINDGTIWSTKYSGTISSKHAAFDGSTSTYADSQSGTQTLTFSPAITASSIRFNMSSGSSQTLTWQVNGGSSQSQSYQAQTWYDVVSTETTVSSITFTVGGSTAFYAIDVDGVILKDPMPGQVQANRGGKCSPFTDPASQKFGVNRDQEIIKCGVYKSDGSAGLSMIDDIGFKPQWILTKAINKSDNWNIMDSMRGWHHTTSRYLVANLSQDEQGPGNYGWPTERGVFPGESTTLTGVNDTIVWMAIRGADGALEKKHTDGFKTFGLSKGGEQEYDPAYSPEYYGAMRAGLTTSPGFTRGFPVDHAWFREPASNDQVMVGSREWGNGMVGYTANNYTHGGVDASFDWKSNVGWRTGAGTGDLHQSWMWKNGRDFQSLIYPGGINGHIGAVDKPKSIQHHMGGEPEMMIIKNLDYQSGNSWAVYHKYSQAVDGTGSPETYWGQLEETTSWSSVGSAWNTVWNGTAPTSTHFTIGSNINVQNGATTLAEAHYMQALLFRSVTGVSKLGSYIGNGSTTGPEITLGFKPRVLIIKCSSHSGNWMLFDSYRENTSGNTWYIYLNVQMQQVSNAALYEVTDTTFKLISTNSDVNSDGYRYIYYAHS